MRSYHMPCEKQSGKSFKIRLILESSTACITAIKYSTFLQKYHVDFAEFKIYLKFLFGIYVCISVETRIVLPSLW